MTEIAANAAPAANAAKPSPWMACATLDELNAYLKKAKTGGTRADTIRAKWTAAHATAAGATPAESAAAVADVLVLSGDMKEIPLKDGKALHVEDTKDAEHAEHAEAPDAGTQEHPEADPQPRKVTRKDAGTLSGLQKRMDAPLLPRTPAASAVIESIRDAAPGLTTRFIDPNMIDVRDDWNARVDFGDLEELARSIKAQKALDGHGLLNDIRVQDKGDGSGRYWLVDGERRWNAVMGLFDGGESFDIGIPAKVEPADADLGDLTIKMFVANGAKPLLPYEEGMYFKRLQDSGMTIKQMEEKTGRSDSSIWYALALVEADDDLVDAIKKGTIGTTIAKQIAVNARGDKAKQKDLTAKAKDVKKSGDKKKLAALKKEIDDARRAKAAKERPGLKIKARKADEAEIATLGQQVAARLKEVMDKFGLDHDTDMQGWIGADRELQIAANFGALTALKAVMGIKVKVEF